MCLELWYTIDYMGRLWAFWRRLQYGTGFVFFWALIFAIVYMVYFYTPGNCFDGKMNGDERGIDCGGPCVRICAFDVPDPTVRWVRSFEIVPGRYNVVAYIENHDRVAATPRLEYVIELHDEQGLVTSVEGETILPPNSVYPVFEGPIFTGDRRPTEARIVFDKPEMWQPATAGREQFSVRERELFGADSSPRLEAYVYNNALTGARDVEVVATIFDLQGEPLTASRSVVDSFRPRSDERVVFTWPEPIAQTVRSCEVSSDVIIILDRSGSMAADGGDPPEPLESAKNAAVGFVQILQPNDQVGYLSYATTPTFPIEQTLTSDRNQVIRSIRSTRMGTDGIQYTNMGAAFNVALEELTSGRQRDDARKVIVFLTDGDVTRPVNPQTGLRDVEYAAQYARDAAQRAKDANVTIYTIGFGDFFLEISGILDRDVQLIKDLATDPSFYFEAPTIAELEKAYSEIAEDICEEGAAVIDIIPKTDANFVPLR